MTDEAYKEAKEQFYRGHSGGSSLEIITITTVTAVSIFLVQILILAKAIDLRRPIGVIGSAISVILPVHISFTSPESSAMLIAGMAANSLLIALASGVRLRSANLAWQDVATTLNAPIKPFVNTYRGSMMIATCIAILAVDFQNFPRRLAKTETFGVSVMDAGVGSVLFAQAMVSPLARKPKAATAKRMGAALLSSSPLLLLGSVRLIGTRAADYHEHVTEYGVHWNFFFTLSVVSVLGNMIPLSSATAALAALLIIVDYEVLLQTTELQAFILSAPRTDLLSANREGLLGCVGYSSIFFAGVVLGRTLFEKTRTGKEWAAYCGVLGVMAAALWVLLAVMDANGYQVSRRLVNLSYVLWTLAYNTLVLAMFLAVEIAVHFLQSARGESIGQRLAEGGAGSDLLCEAFNRNLLAVFLAGNLMTGAVNLWLPTLTASHMQAFGIVGLYELLLVTLALVLHRRRITLKFW